MKHLIVASKNPVKLNAVLKGFQRMFPNEIFEVEGISAPSNVSDQPKSDEETFLGAKNRANNALVQHGGSADFYIGIEGGIQDEGADMFSFAWVYVQTSDKKCGKGKSGTFYLPFQVAELIRQGKELGEADDIVFGMTNSKQANGAVGILTGDVIDRELFYIEAVILALIPFKNEGLYFKVL